MPRAAMPEVLREIDAWVERTGERLPFPVEVRFGAADEPWLSTAHGRETAWIAVHQYHRMDHTPVLRRRAVDPAGARRPAALGQDALAGGRPSCASCYPRFDDAMAVRDRVDPERLFGNDYLERVFSG